MCFNMPGSAYACVASLRVGGRAYVVERAIIARWAHIDWAVPWIVIIMCLSNWFAAIGFMGDAFRYGYGNPVLALCVGPHPLH